MGTLKQKLKGAKRTKPGRNGIPLWKGPKQDGITQSLLSAFLFCRERFRLQTIEGWKKPPQFEHMLEYGQMFHCCEDSRRSGGDWKKALLAYCKKLIKKYPLQQEQVAHWHRVCALQYPHYVEYWKRHESRKKRVSLCQEKVFSVPYYLPSGNTVLLRGKWDEIVFTGKQLLLGENKTKGTIDEQQLKTQLKFDLQTMFYLVALKTRLDEDNASNSLLGRDYGQVRGIVYNVVRRPLSGGKGTIKQLKNETRSEYYQRVATYFEEEPERYFYRWEVTVLQEDVEAFEKTFLVPVLESLCEWYEWVAPVSKGTIRGINPAPWNNPIHWRTPFGTWNPLSSRGGGATVFDNMLESGSTLDVVQADSLFRELEN